MNSFKVLMNQFRSEPDELRHSLLLASERVLNSGHYILGTEVHLFEKAFAEYCGSTNAIGVASGLDAIEIGLRALGIGSGDEVITTSVSAFATALAILKTGATPVLADVRREDANLSIESAERCLSERTKCVVLVHLYGHLSCIEDWQRWCKERRLILVEDCAQSHGTKYGGKSSGTFGSLGCYSFYPTKNLGALGDGGAIITNDSNIAQLSRTLRNYGQVESYKHLYAGLNSRLDEIQAAFLRERLTWLDRFNARRREIAETYFKTIKNDEIELLSPPNHLENHCYHLFVVRTNNRSALSSHLASRGIQTLVHYPVPLHHQPACKSVRMDPNGLVMAELHSRTCISIPCHPQMSSDDVIRVIDALNSYAK